MTVEPGRQLAGRYRVEDLLAERAGARMWRAVDEVLRRSVAVDVLPSDSPRASALVQAARRSAVVTDGRFLRVLDAAEENGDVYVVREWAPGESLDMILADGPLPHRRAAWIVHEVAEAVSAAHSAGIYHLRLMPENVLVTDTGGVKIIGLATDAALYGVKHADAEAEDVRGLGRLLYAALVARWPGGPPCALPTAPAEHGRMMRPGQVRAGVPRQIDEVCDRILGEPPRHQAAPLRHASAVAAELSATVSLATDAPGHHDPDATQAVGLTAPGRPGATATRSLHQSPATRTSALPDQDATPQSAPVPPQGTGEAGSGGTRHIAPVTTPSPQRTSGGWQPPASTAPAPAAAPGGAHRSRRGLFWVVAVAVVAGLAAVSFFIGLNSNPGGSGEADDQADGGGGPNAAQQVQPVGISSVSAFDPFGEDGENDDEAPLVLDGDGSTAWSTLSYEGNPEFGGLKPGLGLVLDLGQRADVSRVTLALGGSGTDLEVRAAPPSSSTAPSDPDAFDTVGSATDAAGRTVVELDRSVSTRFLLVWLTELPPEDGGTFRGSISEITAEG